MLAPAALDPEKVTLSAMRAAGAEAAATRSDFSRRAPRLCATLLYRFKHCTDPQRESPVRDSNPSATIEQAARPRHQRPSGGFTVHERYKFENSSAGVRQTL